MRRIQRWKSLFFVRREKILILFSWIIFCKCIHIAIWCVILENIWRRCIFLLNIAPSGNDNFLRRALANIASCLRRKYHISPILSLIHNISSFVALKSLPKNDMCYRYTYSIEFSRILSINFAYFLLEIYFHGIEEREKY